MANLASIYGTIEFVSEDWTTDESLVKLIKANRKFDPDHGELNLFEPNTLVTENRHDDNYLPIAVSDDKVQIGLEYDFNAVVTRDAERTYKNFFERISQFLDEETMKNLDGICIDLHYTQQDDSNVKTNEFLTISASFSEDKLHTKIEQHFIS